MNTKLYKVYRHRRIDTNQIFYIGIGNENRPYDFNKRSTWWKKIYNKTKIEVEILYTNLSKDDACELEEFLILLYGRRDLNTGPLVNMTNGGDNGPTGYKITQEHKNSIIKSNKTRTVSEETRLKMGEKSKGRIKTEKQLKIISELGKKSKGRKCTEETKEKLRLLRTGKMLSETTKNKMSEKRKGKIANNRMLVLDLSTGIFFNSIKEAAINFNLNKITLRTWLIDIRLNKTNLRLV